MSDDPKVNADEPVEEKSEELTPQEQEHVSGGAFDAYLQLGQVKGED